MVSSREVRPLSHRRSRKDSNTWMGHVDRKCSRMDADRGLWPRNRHAKIARTRPQPSHEGRSQERAVKRKTLGLIVLVASVIAAGVQPTWLFGMKAAAQSPQAQARSVPMFEVDAAWPKVPSQWKLGDASSFAIDAQDNVWLLHRPRTLKPEDAAKAAPPIVVFDAAGNFIKAWGGPGSGYDWPEREHGIHIDHKGFVWLGGGGTIVRPRAPPGSTRPPMTPT